MTPEIDIKVSNLEKDHLNLKYFVEKLEVNIDKLTAISLNIEKLLAVHETSLNSHLKTQREINVEVHETLEKLEDEMNIVNNKIADKIEKMSDFMRVKFDQLTTTLNQKPDISEIQSLQRRIESLEKWKWYVVGISTAAAFIFSSAMNIAKLLG